MIEKKVNLRLDECAFPERIRVSQFDTMWKFVFGILYKSQPWQIPTGATAVLNGKKPDGNVFAFSGTIADNKVAVDCDVQMTAVAGAVLCELSILSDGKVVGTVNFIMDVEAAPKSPDDVSSESTLPAYGEILDRIAEMEGGVDDALSSTSENPVQNKVIKAALDGKVDGRGAQFVDREETRENYKNDVRETIASYLSELSNNQCVVGGPKNSGGIKVVSQYSESKGYTQLLTSAPSRFDKTSVATIGGVDYHILFSDCTTFVSLLTKCIKYTDSPYYLAWSNPSATDSALIQAAKDDDMAKDYTVDYLNRWVGTGSNAMAAGSKGKRLYYNVGGEETTDSTAIDQLQTGDLVVFGNSKAVSNNLLGLHHIGMFVKDLSEINEYAGSGRSFVALGGKTSNLGYVVHCAGGLNGSYWNTSIRIETLDDMFSYDSDKGYEWFGVWAFTPMQTTMTSAKLFYKATGIYPYYDYFTIGDGITVNKYKGEVFANNMHSIPSGGTAGQLLTKNSATDFDAEWKTPSGTGRFYVEGTSPSWHTLYFDPDYIQANVTPEVNTDNLNINGRYISGSAYTEYQYLALPAPMKSLYFGGIGDRGGAYVSGVDNIRSVGVRYRIVFPDAQDNATTIKKVYMRYSLAGRIEAPQTNTRVPYDQVGARQALSIAQSYVDAQIGGRKFAYGKNWLYTKDDTLNVDGYGRVECDTYMSLVLRGIDYAHSPYALPTSTKTFDYDTLDLNPNNYPWADRLCNVIYNNKYLHRDVRFASDLSWMMWYLGGVFSDIKNAKPGDLVFWNKPESGQYFGYISHVGMLDFDENGTPWVYEVTSEGYSDGRVVQKVPFSQRRRDPCYFARIDYRTTGGSLPDDDDGAARTARPATLPSGGAVGQVLKKRSGTDYDAEWAEESGGGSVTVDDALSATSTNPVQNKVLTSALDNKVDVVPGKGLSANDYTTAEKNKLAGIQAGAQVNPTAVSAFSNDSRYISYNDETDFVSMALSGNTVTVNKSFMTLYGLFASQKKVFFTLPLSRTNVVVMEISKVDVSDMSIELFTVVENTRYSVTITSADSGMSGTLTLTNMTPIPSGGAAGQFLVKQSATDYDAAWVTVPNANGVSF